MYHAKKIFNPETAPAVCDHHKGIRIRCIGPPNRDSQKPLLLIMEINAFVAPASTITEKTVLVRIERVKWVGDSNLLLQPGHNGGSSCPGLLLQEVIPVPLLPSETRRGFR